MTNKELLTFIKEEFDRNGFVYKNRKDFIEKLLPDEDYELYRSNLSNWFGGKPGKINKKEFLVALEKRIGFNSSVWSKGSLDQRDIIRKAVKIFLHPPLNEFEMFPEKSPLTPQQESLLLKIKETKKEQIDPLLFKEKKFLEKSPKNQSFLLELISILFDKGLYDTLATDVFPSLLEDYSEKKNIKILKAHTFGSLTIPNYIGAASLLKHIEANSSKDNLEIKTAFISNMRRDLLEKETPSREKIESSLKTLIHYYTNIFEEENHHYYPAINLTYLLILSQHISPNSPMIDSNDLLSIYSDSKASILVDKYDTEDNTTYYAKMSEIEFLLLLNKNESYYLLENLLEEDNPLPTHIERTIRMMKFFVKTLKEFSIENSDGLIKRFSEIIKVLEEYASH